MRKTKQKDLLHLLKNKFFKEALSYFLGISLEKQLICWFSTNFAYLLDNRFLVYVRTRLENAKLEAWCPRIICA